VIAAARREPSARSHVSFPAGGRMISTCGDPSSGSPVSGSLSGVSTLTGVSSAPSAGSAASAYRAPFRAAGEDRLPTLTWPRELPIEGEPRDVTGIVESYGTWLSASEVPKLFVNADPGAILTGALRKWVGTWPSQHEVTVRGKHYLQEDSAHAIGKAIAEWHTRRHRS
jgi:hypothetical protein